MKKEKASLRYKFIVLGIAVLLPFLGIAIGQFCDKPIRFFVLSIIRIELAVLFTVFAVQDLISGKVKMERYGARATYNRGHFIYWVYLISCFGLVGYFIWPFLSQMILFLSK